VHAVLAAAWLCPGAVVVDEQSQLLHRCSPSSQLSPFAPFLTSNRTRCASFTFFSFLMAKAYHSLPLDEEESLAGNGGMNRSNEKWSWKEVTESIPSKMQKFGPSWIWLVHAALLSISIAILAMSYCVVQMSHGVTTIPKTWCTFCLTLYSR